MKNNCMPVDMRDCPHCEARDSLAYYKEDIKDIDLYYCQECFGITEWTNASIKIPINGEAYPDRENRQPHQ